MKIRLFDRPYKVYIAAIRIITVKILSFQILFLIFNRYDVKLSMKISKVLIVDNIYFKNGTLNCVNKRKNSAQLANKIAFVFCLSN